MSVSTALSSKMYSLAMPKLEEQAYKPAHFFKAGGTATGDASAGTVSQTIALKGTNSFQNIYWILRDFKAFTNDTTASKHVCIRIAPSEWEHFGSDFGMASSPTFPLYLSTMTVPASINTTPLPDMRFEPIYLGKITYAAAGTITVEHNVNSDGLKYTCVLSFLGYLKDPFSIMHDLPLRNCQ